MSTELRDGNPVQVLLAVADEVDADLIVVGSRGFGGFPTLLLGSTSTQLAQHSPVDRARRAPRRRARPMDTRTSRPRRPALRWWFRAVRPLRADDADQVRALYGALLRGVAVPAVLLAGARRRRAVRLTRHTADDPRHCMLAAEVDGHVVGLGEYDVTDDAGIAEVAFMVEDDQQGRGLGTALLESLVQRAVARGIRPVPRLYLRPNRQMADVFAHAGFDVTWDHEDVGIGGVDFELVPDRRAGSTRTRTVTTSPRRTRSPGSSARARSPSSAPADASARSVARSSPTSSRAASRVPSIR